MSLAFTFQLSPAQTTFLLKCAFGHYVRSEDSPQSPLLPDFESPFFVSISRKLMQKGLITHDATREPAHVATEMGVAMAKQIVRDAREIVRLDDESPGRRRVVRRKVRT